MLFSENYAIQGSHLSGTLIGLTIENEKNRRYQI